MDKYIEKMVELYVVTENEEINYEMCSLIVGVYTTEQMAQNAITICKQDGGIERECWYYVNHMQLNKMPRFIYRKEQGIDRQAQ